MKRKSTGKRSSLPRIGNVPCVEVSIGSILRTTRAPFVAVVRAHHAGTDGEEETRPRGCLTHGEDSEGVWMLLNMLIEEVVWIEKLEEWVEEVVWVKELRERVRLSKRWPAGKRSCDLWVKCANENCQ